MTAASRTPRALRLIPSLAALVAILCLSPGLVTASGPDGRISGFVTEYGSGAPIVAATIHIEATDLPWGFDTTTDPTGYFEVAVPPHRYNVKASGPAHAQVSVGVAVGSGETTWANVTLVLAGPRSARLLGYVTDSGSGLPVTSGRVAAGPVWYMTSGYANSTSLNASGYYEMNLEPSQYDVTWEATGYTPWTESYLYLSSGEVLWYNVTLDPNPVNGWVNGTIYDADTALPIPGAEVSGRIDGVFLPTVTADANGTYSLPSPSGSLELVADAPGYAPTLTSTYAWGSGTQFLDIDLTPLSMAVMGFVRDGVTGGALPGVVVTVSPLFFDGYYDQTTTDANGYYDVPLPDDYFVVSASKAGYTTGSTWVFFFSGNSAWANLTLWPIVSTVSGYLVDSATQAPVPGITMNAIDIRTGYFLTTTSDGFGFFTFALPPSPAISIWAYGNGVYAGNVAYVGTRPYETTWVNISLERMTAEVVAVVTNAVTGLPVSGASVIAAWYYGSDSVASNATGDAIVDVPIGVQVFVTVIASGYQTWMDDLTPSAGSNPLSIALYPDLPADVRVRGYVKDDTGSPMWSARVEARGYGDLVTYTYTDSSGYYDLWIVAQPQTVRALENGYAADEAAVAPSPGEEIWLNLTLSPDGLSPQVVRFTATPNSNIAETNPTSLVADLREAALESAAMSILMLHSASGGIGTFLNLGRLDPDGVTVSEPTPGNYTISSSWDTRTQVAQLSSGATSVWWPAITGIGPFLAGVNGYWDNDTLSTPIPGSAVFDTRDGRLLFVYTLSGFIDPRDQPTSTFAPYAAGLRVDLSTAAIAGAVLVTGPALSVGGLGMTLSPVVPSGRYGALLEAWDTAGGYTQAAVLFDTGPDTVPPVAVAGPDITADEDAPVAFDGTASSDNLGIASYTWTFVDGTPQTLTGPTPTHVFSAPGSYVVALTVTDGDGNSATDTLVVTVRDVTAPAVSMTSPADGATVSGAVLVGATATDNVAVVRVEFLVDGVSVANDTAAPFEHTLPAGSLSAGNHTIEVIAHDAAGNSGSDIRTVRVVPAPPGGGGPGPDVFGSGLIPLLFILLIVAAAIGGAAFIMVRRRRPPPPAPYVPGFAPVPSAPVSAPPPPEPDPLDQANPIEEPPGPGEGPL